MEASERKNPFRRRKAILMPAILAALATALMAGGTYALWTANAKVSNHLQAGYLDISLIRTNLTKVTLDNETGFLKTVIDDAEVDFSDTSTENANIFGIEEGELIVPTSSFKADLEIMNGKKVDRTYVPSSVAFDYGIYIVLDSEASSDKLASQLTVTFTVGGDEVSKKKLSEYDAGAVYSSYMTKQDTSNKFTVAITFEDLEKNNLAQDKEVKFDLVVKATQKTEA